MIDTLATMATMNSCVIVRVSFSLLLGGSYFQLITLKYGLCLDKTLSSHGAGLK
jgi:hypothetical protein